MVWGMGEGRRQWTWTHNVGGGDFLVYQDGSGTWQPWRGVRTARHMYARFRSRSWVLYDLEKDPYERNNLVEDRAAAPLVQEMEGKLQSWMKRTGDSWDFNWSYPVEDAGRLYRTGTFYTVAEYLAAIKEPAQPPQSKR